MNQPPQDVIDDAVNFARQSPCQKRKVGATIFLAKNRLRDVDVVCGFNGAPSQSVACDGSEACRRSCRDRCVHAEQRAIVGLHRWLGSPVPSERSDDLEPGQFDLVHVKLDAHGAIEACTDGPSCVRCSAEILDVGIGGVWLYEFGTPPDELAEAASRGIACLLSGYWRRYTATEFHQATCRNLGVYNP